MTSGIRVIVTVLAVAGAGLSVVLLLSHHGVSTGAAQQICGAGGDGGCDAVLSSEFAAVGGWSLAAIGVGFYSSMVLLLGSTWLAAGAESARRYVDAALFVAWSAFGLAVALDAVLFVIQWAVLESFCRMCLGTYLINVACVGLLWPARIHRPALAAQWAGEGSVILKSWLLASVLLFGMSFVSDSALTAVGEQQFNFLGQPPPGANAPTEATATSADPSDDAAVPVEQMSVAELRQHLAIARSEADRLQETLDDPNKLEAYQMEKTAREFQAGSTLELALESIPFKGPAEAPIKVVEFSDFMCPYCRNLAGALSGYLPQSEGRVSVYFKNYPLEQTCNPDLNRTIHIGACDLALGAICAQEQDRFWEYHDAVFAAPPNRADRATVVGIAAKAGLDQAKLTTCLDSDAAARRLEEDISEGKRLGVNSTPTIFINGKKLNGVSAFLIAINSEADRLGLR